MKKRLIRLGAGLALVASAAALTPATSGATTQITVWADNDRAAAVTSVLGAWGKKNGATITVVKKGFGDIRDGLKTVDTKNAPDLIVGAHDWVGELSANGSIVPIRASRTLTSKFPQYALDAFSYPNAKGVKILYGAPIALENVALAVNTALAKVPTSFADLERQALAFQSKAAGNVGLGVPNDPYHYYPFLSGLCGYLFGRDAKGNLSTSDFGIANSRLLANVNQVDGWNVSGLLSWKVTGDIAQSAFLAGKSPFWVTGPWNADLIKKSGLKVRLVQVPKNSCASVPFLGVQGFMLSKFAKTRGTETQARAIVEFLMGSKAQSDFALINGRAPANNDAAASVNDPILKQFGAASTGGVPMPNIPEMSSVWSDMGKMWENSLKGGNATSARGNFRTAEKNIKALIS
jgi:arabinogalactan oligomer/maltooligosaccharide transport system substrate-binding protein